MRKSSWIVLGICGALIIGLVIAYSMSQSQSEILTEKAATGMLRDIQVAVRHKNVNAIMDYITSEEDAKIANLKPDQLRLLIARALHAMQSPQAEVSNVTFAGGTRDATLTFDLKVHDDSPSLDAIPYSGHITLQLQRVPVSHLLGLIHSREWRIVGGSTTGPDPGNYGDY